MTTQTKISKRPANERRLIREISALLVSLKREIGDEYRCSDDSDDDRPGMCVTVGTNDMESWSYQTGDNSYTGACYHTRNWGVIYLYRTSNSRELAEQAVDEMAESFESNKASQ